MAKYSALPAVEEVFGRFVRDEDAPAALYPAALARDALSRAIGALDPDIRVHPVVSPTVELSAVALAAKATRLFPEGAVLYAELHVYLSSLGRAALLSWEWRRSKSEKEPSRGARPPLPSPRAETLLAGVRSLLEAQDVPLVPFEEASRVVRVEDDPVYEGAYYEIQVFEALFGMGYPERQR
jgi:hypothetical protein